ncbi:hypothetical protein [Propylenella binzhouense]|uniref:Uncharacterized protein n=1 Tax=Propylenella binzhouense TaxID=2555902 RepID=A0A964T3N3_9HYPH|nr:hypothetical protein [Propylenella binzhouense]MYZ47324.1 hypothetical protein [Propylenella binzhouense]
MTAFAFRSSLASGRTDLPRYKPKTGYEPYSSIPGLYAWADASDYGAPGPVIDRASGRTWTKSGAFDYPGRTEDPVFDGAPVFDFGTSPPQNLVLASGAPAESLSAGLTFLFRFELPSSVTLSGTVRLLSTYDPLFLHPGLLLYYANNAFIFAPNYSAATSTVFYSEAIPRDEPFSMAITLDAKGYYAFWRESAGSPVKTGVISVRPPADVQTLYFGGHSAPLQARHRRFLAWSRVLSRSELATVLTGPLSAAPLVYWGVSPYATLGSAGIVALGSSERATTVTRSFVADASVNGGSNYVYYAYPAGWGEPASYKVLGFETVPAVDTVSVTADGTTRDYLLLRTPNPTSSDSVVMEIA